MDKKVSVVNTLPIIFAILLGTYQAIYFYTLIEVSGAIGRPSSTHAIGYLFVPIYAVIAAVIGGVIGVVTKVALLKFIAERYVGLLKISVGTIIGVALIAYFASSLAHQRAVQAEEFNQPRVLSNRASFDVVKSIEGKVDIEFYPGMIWSSMGRINYALDWKGRNLSFDVRDYTKMKVSSSKGTEFSYDFSPFSYLTELRALRLENSHGEDYLAILATLRATSRRSILLIYDDNLELVYEQLIERCGAEQVWGKSTYHSENVIVVSLCKSYTINIDR